MTRVGRPEASYQTACSASGMSSSQDEESEDVRAISIGPTFLDGNDFIVNATWKIRFNSANKTGYARFSV